MGISPDKQHSPYGSPDWYCLLLLGKLQPGMTQQQALTRLTSDFDKTIFNAEDNQPKPRLYFSSASAADREAEKFGSPVVQALISTVLFVSLWLASCAEFRTQGLALAGMFIRWRRIAGYSWESKVGKFELLRFRLSGPWMWWPIPVRMLVKPDLRPQVDELLKQQLLEWPTVFHR